MSEMIRKAETLQAGVLEKQERNWMLRRRWRQRYFVLSLDSLTCTFIDDTTRVLSTYPRDRVIQILYSDRATNPLEFIVLFDYKKLLLRAANLIQRNAWIQSLKPSRRYTELHPLTGPPDSMLLRLYIEKFAQPPKQPFAELLQRTYTSQLRWAFEAYVSGLRFRTTLKAISEQNQKTILEWRRRAQSQGLQRLMWRVQCRLAYCRLTVIS
jgi:hypothetical protein